MDKLVIQGDDTAAWVAQTPLNDRAKADLIALIGAPADYMPGLTPAAKLEKLAQITYKEFLLGYVKVDPQLVDYFQKTRPVPISAPGLTRPRRWMRVPTIIPALRGWIWAKQI